MSIPSVDLVAVFDDNMEQLFQLARPGKATITESAKLAEHPVESGGTVVDNRVIQPVEIELEIFVTEYKETYQKIKAAFLGQKLLTVQTLSGMYLDMAIEAMPHEETPEMLDVLSMILKLKEVKLVTAQFQSLPPQKVKKPNDASTVNAGEVKTKESAAIDWGGKIKESWNSFFK